MPSQNILCVGAVWLQFQDHFSVFHRLLTILQLFVKLGAIDYNCRIGRIVLNSSAGSLQSFFESEKRKVVKLMLR